MNRSMEPVVADGHDTRLTHSFERIKSLLSVDFVPTVYRVLGRSPELLDAAADQLERVVAAARGARFVETTRTIGSFLPIDGTMRNIDDRDEVVDTIQRYREANPLNLLFIMSIFPALPSPSRPIMQPPLPPRATDILTDILEAHGDVLVPGLWRELAMWPTTLDHLWRSTRDLAEEGWVAETRAEVLASAAAVLDDCPKDLFDRDLIRAADDSGIPELDWFPLGIATMVVEGELLHKLCSRSEDWSENE